MNAEELLSAALVKKTPAERAAYLDEACGQDASLRAVVESLLRSHEDAGSFLEQPLFDNQGTPGATIDDPVTERPGAVIGPYKLLQQIGEGGMGVVFMAEQTSPVQRKVALKIIKPGMDSRQVISRFEAERQALALMDHPNIAKVFDGGTVGQAFQPDLSKGKSGKIDGLPSQAGKPDYDRVVPTSSWSSSKACQSRSTATTIT
jgi:serine/threonine protein kinase